MGNTTFEQNNNNKLSMAGDAGTIVISVASFDERIQFCTEIFCSNI